jgi:hypothetical protein
MNLRLMTISNQASTSPRRLGGATFTSAYPSRHPNLMQNTLQQVPRDVAHYLGIAFLGGQVLRNLAHGILITRACCRNRRKTMKILPLRLLSESIRGIDRGEGLEVVVLEVTDSRKPMFLLHWPSSSSDISFSNVDTLNNVNFHCSQARCKNQLYQYHKQMFPEMTVCWPEFFRMALQLPLPTMVMKVLFRPRRHKLLHGRG